MSVSSHADPVTDAGPPGMHDRMDSHRGPARGELGLADREVRHDPVVERCAPTVIAIEHDQAVRTRTRRRPNRIGRNGWSEHMLVEGRLRRGYQAALGDRSRPGMPNQFRRRSCLARPARTR